MAVPEVRVEPATQDFAPGTMDWRARSRVILNESKAGPVRVEIIATGLSREDQVRIVTEMAVRLRGLLIQPPEVVEAAMQLIAADDALRTADSHWRQVRETLRTVLKATKG